MHRDGDVADDLRPGRVGGRGRHLEGAVDAAVDGVGDGAVAQLLPVGDPHLLPADPDGERQVRGAGGTSVTRSVGLVASTAAAVAASSVQALVPSRPVSSPPES